MRQLTAILAALLCLTQSGFGQGFSAQIYSSGEPMTTSSEWMVPLICPGDIPLPWQTPAYIYWDRDSDGPDGTDPRPAMGQGPGRLNTDRFYTGDGLEWGAAGHFGGTLTCPDSIPDPPRFYFSIPIFSESAGQIGCYVTPVITLAPGDTVIEMPTSQFMCGGWLCAGAPPCDPTTDLSFRVSDLPVTVGVDLCQGYFTGIIVWDNADISRPPYVRVTGCTPQDSFRFLPEQAQYLYFLHDWIFGIEHLRSGCAVLHLDFDSWPAPIDVFTAEYVDSARIRLDWRFASQHGLSGLELWRVDRYNTAHVADIVPADSSVHDYAFTDTSIVFSEPWYRYTIIESDSAGNRSAARCVYLTVPALPVVEPPAASDNFALAQNFPNPFNATTVIRFELAGSGPVTLAVYDLLGRQVRLLVDRVLESGSHEALLDAASLPSGVYFYRIETRQGSAYKKMLLLR